MIQGYNKANGTEKIIWESLSRNYPYLKTRFCVFLSHKFEDKPKCRKIAAYLKTAGIDYYLDEEDSVLQQAVIEDNPYRITESIKKGIRESTHMLCIISKKSKTSEWIPFEIGYAHAAIIDKAMQINIREQNIKLSILLFKQVSEEKLPIYLKLAYVVRGSKSLNSYISKLLNKKQEQILTEGLIEKHTKTNHPLDDILNWQM